jgi:hypothetical protein
MKQFLIGLDQIINTKIKLSDGYGKIDEMLSARAWRLREEYPSIHLWIDRLFFWDKNHCQECYQIEKERKQLPMEYNECP